MNRGVIPWINGLLFLYLALSGIAADFAYAAEIDPHIEEELQKGQTVDVIVLLKEEALQQPTPDRRSIHIQALQNEVIRDIPLSSNDLVLEKTYATVNAFSAKASAEGIQHLLDDPRVERVVADQVFHISLTDSLPLIQVNNTRKLWVQNSNLTGAGETVCVIDTGIDTDHPAFTGRIIREYCSCQVSDKGLGGCCPDNTTIDSSAEDNQGHGTHVAGIAAGSSPTMGVAPNAGIVAIKVCDALGDCSSSDIIAGIDWCTNNHSLFNISVISMSLGGGGPYNQYCNNDSIAPAVNSAVAQNISVVIAAGNNGFTDGISLPACIQNATAIGAVSDSDGILYNRGNILSLLAPGQTITAPYLGGGTASLSGTSMAAPHASGAMLLLLQFAKAQLGRVLTPTELKDTLNKTGTAINDASSGLRFYRLNAWDAIISLDTIKPGTSFASPTPAASSLHNTTSITINISSTEALKNSTLTWNGINESMAESIGFYTTTKSSLVEGIYTIKVTGSDWANNSNATEERIITLNEAPNITITAPADRQVYNSSFILNISLQEGAISNLSSCFYNITSFSNQVVQQNSNASINQATFAWSDIINSSNATFSTGNYTLHTWCNDTFGLAVQKNVSWSINNGPLSVILHSPFSGANLSAGLITLNTSIVNVYSIHTVLFNVSNGSSSLLLAASAAGDYWNATLNTSSVSEGAQTIMVDVNDTKSNRNATVSAAVTVDQTNPAVILLTPENTTTETSSTTVMFQYNVTDNLLAIANCSIIINGATTQVNASITQRTAQLFSSTLTNADYLWSVSCQDTAGNTGTSDTRTLTIDTITPTISGISSGTPAASSATISWSTDELANASVNYGNSSSLGTKAIRASLATSHSISLSSLAASTIYTYNVTSCDAAGHCQTKGTFQFTTAAGTGSSSSSSSGGAGGGGGGGGGTTVTAAATTAEPTAITESSEGAGPPVETTTEDTPSEVPGTPAPAPFTTTIMVSSGQATLVPVNLPTSAVKALEITSTTERQVNITVTPRSEPPQDLPTLAGAYQLLEITVDIPADELEGVKVRFTVPKSWMDEQQAIPKNIVLQTFDDKWAILPTAIVDEQPDIVLYEASVNHFSFFAITTVKGDSGNSSSGNSITGWIVNILPDTVGRREMVLIGVLVAVMLLLVVYKFVREEE